MIRVLICDDQDLVCAGLCAILQTASGIEVVGVAHDGNEALELLPHARPDIVLMDLKMPGMNGIQATAHIRQKFPAVRVLILTTYDADEWVFDAVRSGASGYLLKDTPREALLAAIQGTVEGKTHVDPAVAGKLFNQVARNTPPAESSLKALFSERELEVLCLLARGFVNAEIARRLHLSEGTIKNYISAILNRLDVQDRTQAAVIAIRQGLVDLNDES
jgi:DNA-binding NarL/FixJ family response regulator